MHYLKNEKETIFDFLHKLSENNNRKWFYLNKNQLSEAQEFFYEFIYVILQELLKIDKDLKAEPISNYVFRIHRDIRFSKDKTPYKTHFGAYIANGGKKSNQAGYYIHIQPNNQSFIAAGIYRPEKDDLLKIRTHIQQNPERFKAIVENSTFKEKFGEIGGEKLKTSPREFSKDEPMIYYINHKNFFISKAYSDEELLQDSFLHDIQEDFKAMLDFNKFLNEAVD
jgi:uncharacterized protein (TIGR02453 family)